MSSEHVVLDTNVLVHLIRANTVGKRIEAEHHLRDRVEKPLISVVTVGEIWALALKLSWQDAKLAKLETVIRELVIVHPHQGDVIQQYAAIDKFCEKDMKPARPMAQNDMWIAATAAASSARLLTTDSDFDHLKPKFIELSRVDARTGAPVR